MNADIERKDDSTFFFNNIRAIVVMLVILLHVALTYSTFSDKWWIVVDTQKTILADILSGSLDIMLMSILFFIAGYFTLPSFTKCSYLQFFCKKLKKLMLPWLLGVLLLNPFLVNVIQFQSNNEMSFLKNIIFYYSCFFQIPKMIIQNRSESPLFFSHYHFWFLSLLFFFFIGFIIFKKIDKRNKTIKFKRNVKKIFLIDITSLIVISSLGYFLFYSLFEDKWFVISIIQFQISRIIPYIAFYIFGIRSYTNGWIYKFSIIKKPFIHLIISIGITLIYLLFYVYLKGENSLCLLFSLSILRYAICTYYLLIFLKIGKQYFNKKNFFTGIFSKFSFGVYVIHLNITVLFSIIFLRFIKIIPEFKIILVFTSTVLSSYIIIILYDKTKSIIQKFKM